jgi:hypothetical protein
MMYGKKKPMTSGKKGGMNKAFKPCATCPNPKACKAKGMCKRKAGKPMRKAGQKGAPTKQDFINAKKTAKNK